MYRRDTVNLKNTLSEAFTGISPKVYKQVNSGSRQHNECSVTPAIGVCKECGQHGELSLGNGFKIFRIT